MVGCEQYVANGLGGMVTRAVVDLPTSTLSASCVVVVRNAMLVQECCCLGKTFIKSDSALISGILWEINGQIVRPLEYVCSDNS